MKTTQIDRPNPAKATARRRNATAPAPAHYSNDVKLEYLRLEALIRRLWPIAMRTERPDTMSAKALEAMSLILDIIEREAQLLGLDAPASADPAGAATGALRPAKRPSKPQAATIKAQKSR